MLGMGAETDRFEIASGEKPAKFLGLGRNFYNLTVIMMRLLCLCDSN